MANAIVGSAEIVLLATLIGLPVGFIAGVYLAEFGGKTFAVPGALHGRSAERHALDRHRHVRMDVDRGPDASLLRASRARLALSLMLIPITARSTEQFLLEVPRAMREGSLALGASKWRTIATVVVPAARKGIMTGMILGVARISGETAPLLFTALNNQFWSTGLSEPTASLPVMIYNSCDRALRRLAPPGVGRRTGSVGPGLAGQYCRANDCLAGHCAPERVTRKVIE